MNNATKRKFTWGVALLAIALTTGRASGQAQQTTDSSEQSQQVEPLVGDDVRANDAADPKDTPPDQMTEDSGGNEQQRQTTASDEEETKPDSGGPDQTTPPAEQESKLEMENDQQSAGSVGQSQSTSVIGQQIQLSPGPNTIPIWVTGPAPHDLEPNERSYLIAGANLTESAVVIPASGATNPLQDYSVTRLLGSLELLKIVRRFHTSIDYKGGANFSQYSGNPWVGKQIEQLNASESVSWERIALSLVDTFHLTPGVPYSSALGGSNVSDFIGAGPIRHYTNFLSGSVVDEMTPRSGFTLLGAYTSTNYFGLSSQNNHGGSAAVSYNYELTPRTNISTSYMYQDWKFPGGQSDAAQTAQLSYEHEFSPRMTLTLGGGPQFISYRTTITLQGGPLNGVPIPLTSHQTTFLGDAWLSYSIPKGTLSLLYEHLLTSGAGLFAGANTDTIGATLARPILPSWTTSVAAGFTRLSSLGNQTSGAVGNSYQYGFASVSVNRRIGRSLNVSASYQFNEEASFSGCSAASGCGSVIHTALISISWHTLPIFLDRGNSKQQPVPIENPMVDLQTAPQLLP
jgi:hypothetical protein